MAAMAATAQGTGGNGGGGGNGGKRQLSALNGLLNGNNVSVSALAGLGATGPVMAVSWRSRSRRHFNTPGVNLTLDPNTRVSGGIGVGAGGGGGDGGELRRQWHCPAVRVGGNGAPGGTAVGGVGGTGGTGGSADTCNAPLACDLSGGPGAPSGRSGSATGGSANGGTAVGGVGGNGAPSGSANGGNATKRHSN